MFIIGELINGMYEQIGRAIVNKDKSVIQKAAREQVEAGVYALDVNTGPKSKDQISDMCWLVETIQEVVDVPIAIDSPKPKVIAEGLKLVKNKAIINSTSADKEKLDALIPLALQYKAQLIGLTLDKKGVPQDKDRRLEMAVNILSACIDAGISAEDLYIDPIVLPLNCAQAQAKAALESIKEFKMLSDPAPKTIVGLSNVSQGTDKRSLINRTFLVMAQAFGLDAAILDPLDSELVNASITADVILDKQIYCDSFIEAYRKR